AWLPVAWSNTFGGFTVGLRERSNYLGSYDRGLLLAALATGRGATNRFSFYGRWSNPIGHPEPRSQTSVSAWAAEGRAGAKLSVDRSLREDLDLGADPPVGFAGGYTGASPPVRQRRIPVAGADPYETFSDPLLRSRGALFLRPDSYYHAPGNANLRAFRRDLGGRWAVSVNGELTRSLGRRDH